MVAKRILFYILAVVFSAALVVVLFFQDLVQKMLVSKKVAALTGDQCTNVTLLGAGDQKKNPNEVLFISCGGFWD